MTECLPCLLGTSVHEDNVVSEAYAELRSMGVDSILQVYMGKIDDEKAIVDMLIMTKEDEEIRPWVIVEFKNNEHKTPTGCIDCAKPPTSQFAKYCKLGIPIFCVNGFDGIPLLIEYLIEQ